MVMGDGDGDSGTIGSMKAPSMLPLAVWLSDGSGDTIMSIAESEQPGLD